jgi:hypothetical protein
MLSGVIRQSVDGEFEIREKYRSIGVDRYLGWQLLA